MTSIEASARGRAIRAKGNAAERDLAKWLRTWWPDACRAVRNTTPDPGDIAETSVFWSVKYTQREYLGNWMVELDAKSGPGRLGLLVLRRPGRPIPGEWWCWLRLADLNAVLLGRTSPDTLTVEAGTAPVRMELRHLMPLLVRAGVAPEPARAEP